MQVGVRRDVPSEQYVEHDARGPHVRQPPIVTQLRGQHLSAVMASLMLEALAPSSNRGPADRLARLKAAVSRS